MVDPAAQFFLDPVKYIEKFLWIRLELPGAQIEVIPFKLNPIQKKIMAIKAQTRAAGREDRYIVLKSRRVGVTTLEQGLSFHGTATNEGYRAVTLAQDMKSTTEIFEISQLFDLKLPVEFRPTRIHENKKEVKFNYLKSTFYIGTAGSKAFARGAGLQRIHGSEVAQWGLKQEYDVRNLISGLLEAAKFGEVVMESTPKGMGGWFYSTWQKAREGKGVWTSIFIPWWEDGRNKKAFKSNYEKDKLKESMNQEEIALMDKWQLSLEQMHWRRDKIEEHEELFWQEYPEDDITCFVSSGLHWFTVSIIQNLVKYCQDPIEKRRANDVIIWQKPVPGKEYIAGCDVGEGVQGGDYSFCGILERESCKQVAALHCIERPEMFATEAAKLCHEYNQALMAVEANNHGHSMLNTLRNTLHYPRLYYHLDYDEVKRTNVQKLGWRTTGKTRPILLDELKQAVEDEWMLVNDKEFLNECMTFVDDGKGKYEARQGFYDDRVMGWGIAVQARKAPKIKLEFL